MLQVILSTIIYHNPRCSKSRNTLALLEQNNIDFTVVKYLDSALDSNTLNSITNALGCSIRDILRKGGSAFKELNLKLDSLDEQQLIDIVVDNPILLERPIVLHNGKAAVGRPPENVLSLFNCELNNE